MARFAIFRVSTGTATGTDIDEELLKLADKTENEISRMSRDEIGSVGGKVTEFITSQISRFEGDRKFLEDRSAQDGQTSTMGPIWLTAVTELEQEYRDKLKIWNRAIADTPVKDEEAKDGAVSATDSTAK